MTGARACAVALLAGGLLALGHPPGDMPLTAFLAIPALFALVQTASPRRAAIIGWFAGTGYFAVALNWIISPFMVDAAATGWMAPFALGLLAMGLALFWAVAFGLARALSSDVRDVPSLMLFATFWAVAEYLRGTILTGFPWAHLAYIWETTDIIQLAAYIGPHGMALLTILVLGLPAALSIWRLGIPAMLACAALLWWGATSRVPDQTAFTQTSIRIVQPNAAQHLKWQPDMMPVFFERQLEATRGHAGVDLVIWPEVSVPYLMGDRPDLNRAIAEAAGPETRVIIGARRTMETEEGTRWYNALALLQTDGTDTMIYDKHHLVPFGEYLPFPAFWERFGLSALAQNAGRFASGQGPRRLSAAGLPSFQPLICYEAIFPDEILRGDDRPDWLLQITNDAWFGSFSGPFQHLAQARFRAVENGLPMVRAANTGVSAVIDPFGQVMAELPLDQPGVIDALLPAPLPPTPYSRVENLPFWLGSFIFLLFGVALARLGTIRKHPLQ